MNEDIFFDDSFGDSTPQGKGEFSFLITPVTPDNLTRIWRDLSNGKQDCAITKNDITVYLVIQTPPHYGKVSDYLENAKTKQLPYSKIVENAYMNGAISKYGDDGLVTTIENTATLASQLQSARTLQSVTINQHSGGGCGDCKSTTLIAEKDAIIAEQRTTIASLANNLKTVDSIAYELGVKEMTISLFEKMPNEAQRKFVATCIMNADTIEDIYESFENSKAFENVECDNANMTAEKLSSDFHQIITQFNDFVALATDPNSEGGEGISDREMIVMNKITSRFRKYTLDVSRFIQEHKVHI